MKVYSTSSNSNLLGYPACPRPSLASHHSAICLSLHFIGSYKQRLEFLVFLFLFLFPSKTRKIILWPSPGLVFLQLSSRVTHIGLVVLENTGIAWQSHPRPWDSTGHFYTLGGGGCLES